MKTRSEVVQKFYALIVLLAVATTSCTHASDGVVWAEPLEGVAMTEEEIASNAEKALLGSADAAHRLSGHYLLATDNRERQLYWTRIAAENGDARAQFNFAELLVEEGTVESLLRARFWLEQSASQGNVNAKRQLSKMEPQPPG